MNNQVTESHSSEYLLFALGVGVGAGIGILFAPKSGVEVRRELEAKAQDTAQYLKAQSKAAPTSPMEMILKMKDFWLSHRDELQAAAELAKRFYRDVVQPKVVEHEPIA